MTTPEQLSIFSTKISAPASAADVEAFRAAVYGEDRSGPLLDSNSTMRGITGVINARVREHRAHRLHEAAQMRRELDDVKRAARDLLATLVIWSTPVAGMTVDIMANRLAELVRK